MLAESLFSGPFAQWVACQPKVDQALLLGDEDEMCGARFESQRKGTTTVY